MPRSGALAVRDRAPDRGMLVLEQKLSILVAGPGQSRRNPALDVLTGRVPDERLVSLQATLMVRNTTESETPNTASPPTAMVLPVAAIRMAAVARSQRPAPSPWLKADPSNEGPPRLRLVAPPPTRWSRVAWLGCLLAVLTGSEWLRRRLERALIG